METQNKPIMSLEQVLVSYNMLITVLFIFIILMVALYATNKTGFNKSFGYEIFITGPILILLGFLIKEIFVFKQNPQSSWLSSFSQSSQNWFIPVLSLIALFIGILGFFMMLYVGGIFSDKPPENNTPMLLNFVVIIFFIVISAIIFKTKNDADETYLKSLPRPVQDVFHLRTKYTAMLFLFVLILSITYFVNPFGIMTNYGGPVIFFSLFVGIIMVIMITMYQYLLDNNSKAYLLKDYPNILTFLTKGAYILVAIGISFGLIYGALKMMGVFEQDASKPESWGHIIFNLFLFCAMLGILYKLANAGGYLDKNPYYRLILNTLFYIPCLLIVITNKLTNLIGLSKGATAFDPPKPYEYKILVISLLLLVSYFSWIFVGKRYVTSMYLKQGGKQLVNQPVQTDVLTNIASYQSLSGSDKFDYQYGLSFWVYIDSFPPSTNASYNKSVPILSFGDNPLIRYNAPNNSFYISIKQNDVNTNIKTNITENDGNKNDYNELLHGWLSNKTDVNKNIYEAIEYVKSLSFVNEEDADGNRIIYKHPDVQLQKWNHIVLNYNGGTLDVFYNGKLVKSAIEVVPYMKLDMLTIGTDKGISGNIANLMYYKEPLDILTINTLYTSLKNVNPPVISENRNKVIPV